MKRRKCGFHEASLKAGLEVISACSLGQRLKRPEGQRHHKANSDSNAAKLHVKVAPDVGQLNVLTQV